MSIIQVFGVGIIAGLFGAVFGYVVGRVSR